MSIRWKTLLFIGAAIIAVLFGLLLTTQWLLRNNIRQVENQYALTNIEIVQKVFEEERAAVENAASDWVIQRRAFPPLPSSQSTRPMPPTPEFTALDAGDIKFVLGLDDQRQVTFQYFASDLPTPEQTEIVQAFNTAEAHARLASNAPFSGYLVLSNSLVIYAVQPFQPSGSSSAPHTVIFGRPFTQAEFAKMREYFPVSVRLLRSTDSTLSAERQAGLARVFAQDEDFTLTPLATENLAYLKLEPSLGGQACLEISSPRNIFSPTFISIWVFTAGLAMMLLVLAAVFYWMVSRMFIDRLQELKTRVEQSPFSLIMPTAPISGDEISQLFAWLETSETHYSGLLSEHYANKYQLKYLFQLQSLVNEAATLLIQSNSTLIPQAIQETLAAVGNFVHVDRVYIFELTPQQNTMSNTFEWCSPGTQPEIHNLQNISLDLFPWWMKKLRENEVICLQQLDDLPPEASQEKEILAAQNIQALLVVPMFLRNHLNGFIGFDAVQYSKTWLPADITLLRLVGDLLVSTIDRRNADLTLRRSEEQYRQLVELSPDAIFIISDGLIVYANSAARRLTAAFSIEDPVGQEVQDLLKNNDIHNVDSVIQQALDGNASTLYQPVKWTDSRGKIVDIEVAATPFYFNNQPAIQMIAHDVTERNQMVVERLAEMKFIGILNHITGLASTTMDFQSTLQLLADQLGKVVSADGCYITLYQEETGETLAGAAYGPFRDSYHSMQVDPKEKTLTASLMKYEQVLAVEDVFDTPYLSPEIAKKFPARSLIGIPLIIENKKLGAVLISFNDPHSFTAQEIERARKIAGPVSLAVAKAILFEELKTTNQNLIQAYDATIQGWARAIELRDNDTENHTQRVTELTVKLAQRLRLSTEEIQHIRRGAILHDIGKLGIPDEILRKPGKYTAEEFALMKKHTEYAFDMLKGLEFLEPAIDIPYCHHEKWDGSGYPRGLRGEAIPLSARIFCLADVWDALISERPYKPAWPRVQAIEYISNQLGIHFDPRIGQEFLTMLKEMEPPPSNSTAL